LIDAFLERASCAQFTARPRLDAPNSRARGAAAILISTAWTRLPERLEARHDPMAAAAAAR
jgi:hypothetical protein